jgi:hypothetical protein
LGLSSDGAQRVARHPKGHKNLFEVNRSPTGRFVPSPIVGGVCANQDKNLPRQNKYIYNAMYLFIFFTFSIILLKLVNEI